MYLLIPRKHLALTLLLVLFAPPCSGGGISLQSVISGAGPLLTFLVSKDRLSQAKADLIKTDLADTGKCADALESELNAIPKEDTEAKTKKLNAWVRASRCWKPIVLRQNFGAHERTRKIADLIDGIFAAGVVFYSESGAMRASAEGGKSAVDDKVLEKDLEKQLKELKEAMKPE